MLGRELILHPALGACLTLEALAAEAGCHPELVERFVAYGLLEPVGEGDRSRRFDVRAVRRLRTIQRLRADLGVNLPGVAVVLELLERTKALRRELAGLRRR